MSREQRWSYAEQGFTLWWLGSVTMLPAERSTTTTDERRAAS